MKRRLLLFLAIFGTGLALLLWLESRLEDEEVEPAKRVPVQAPPDEGDERFIEVPVQVGEGEADRGVEFSTEGRVSAGVFTETEPRVLELRVEAQDSHPLGGDLYELRDVTVERFDPSDVSAPREPMQLIRAETAEARLDPRAESLLDAAHPVELRGVSARMREGVVFAPISLRTDELTGLLLSRALSTDSDVVVTGRGLNAAGTGMRIDSETRVLTLERDAELEVRRRGGRAASLSSSGPLVARTRAEPRSFAVNARDEARIEIRAAEGASEGDATLTGDAIEILGHTASEGDEPFRLERVTATGAAVLRTADGLFSADEAVIEFDADGGPARALLTGHPSVRLDLRRAIDGPDEQGEEGGDVESIRVELEGEGPLTLALTELRRGAFELEGASELRVPTYSATLRAARRMRGLRTQAGRLGRLIALGDVRGVLEQGTVATDELEIAAVSAREGEVAILLTSTGPTRIDGALEDGRPWGLEATRGLSYRRAGDVFQIPDARGVSLRVGGDEPYAAQVGRLWNLDGRTLAFQSDGGVTFTTPVGRGEGQSLVSRGERSGVLRGRPGRPARLVHAQGWLAADTIDFAPGALRAEGDAAGHWEVEGIAATLDAPWIALADQGGERVLTAGEGTTSIVRSGERSVALEARDLEVRARAVPDPLGGPDRLASASLRARGEVIVDFQGEADVAGRGETFELELTGPATGRGRLLPAAGERLTTAGRLPGNDVSFVLLSETLEFDDESLRARNAVFDVDGIAVGLTSAEAREVGSVRAIAGRLDADASSLLLEDSVYIGRFGERGELWSLDADRALLTADPDAPPREPGEPSLGPDLTRLEAWGGFSLRFDRGMEAAGDRLDVDRATRLVRMTGNPVQVHVPGAYWTAKSFEIDPEAGSVRATRGTLRLELADEVAPWTLSYASIEPRVAQDETIQIISRPVFIDGTRVVRADWAILWIDPQGFRALTTGAGPDEELPPVAPPEGAGDPSVPAAPRMPSLFGGLDDEAGVTGWLRELYLDGDLEVLESGVRRARAGAVYLDFVDGHGWLYDADFTVRSAGQVVRLHTDWLRHSADGSLRADSAVLTSCDYDVPHYTVESGSLSIEPRTDTEGEETSWFIELRDNAIRFTDGPALPLPRIGFAMREDYSIDTDQISVFGAQPFSVGSSARFGTFVRTSVASDLSGFARGFHGFLRKLVPRGSLDMPGLPDGPSLGGLDFGPPPKGELSASAAYLGSRGGLVDLGIEVESQDFYRFVFDGAVVLDNGRDRGLIRVPESDRDSVRWWIRERGRIDLGDQHWLDAVLTTQSDPGVQSEFFESDYLRYEERETWLNWRRADGEDYANVTLEARLDDWRTEVLEQPNGHFYQGRRQVGTWGERPVYYGSDSTVGYLRRIEGDPFYEAGFADGFGDGESLRADTRHRLEVPAPLGRWGLIATPYVEGVGTVWSESATGGSTPARAGVLAGLELASTIWKPLGKDGLHELTGSIGLRTDVGVEDTGGTPYTFDAIESSLDGRFVDVKVRSLLTSEDADHRWDLELALTHAEDSPDVPDGLQPLQVNTDWVTSVGDTLVGVYHDGRYGLQNGRARYQRTLFGIEPNPAVAFGFGHSLGRNSSDRRIYEALSVGARWRVNPKFELEGRQSVSLIDDGALFSEGLVRRYGHDFVFEIELSFREGEGTSFSFSVEPLLLFKRSRFAFVERLRWAQEDSATR